MKQTFSQHEKQNKEKIKDGVLKLKYAEKFISLKDLLVIKKINNSMLTFVYNNDIPAETTIYVNDIDRDSEFKFIIDELMSLNYVYYNDKEIFLEGIEIPQFQNNQNSGLKFDQGKLRWDLLPWSALEEIVKVYTFGTKKYGENTWQGVENAEARYSAALLRHFVAHQKGERFDDESKLLHLAHMAWNALALIWFELKNNK